MSDFWTAEIFNGVPRYVLVPVVVGLIAVCIVLLFNYTRAAPAAIEITQLPGSRIAMAVGDQFAPSDRFTGFVHEASGASIIALELPQTAFEQLKNLQKAIQTFAAQGISGITQHRLSTRNGNYIFLKGDQTTALVDYVKYILIFLDRGVTGMVTANIPRVALATGLVTGSEIEAILGSAEIKPDAPAAPQIFHLDYLGPFEEDVSLLGTTKGYRLKDASNETEKPAFTPIFLVAPSLTQAPIPDLGLFAEKTFQGMDQLIDKVIERENQITVDGLKAYELIGGGTDRATGSPAFVYELMIEAHSGGFFRLMGLAPESERKRLGDEFISIGRSFRAG